MIPISCGSIAPTEPRGDKKEAGLRPSSSRFVLPFAYLPVPATGSGSAWRYRSAEDQWDRRRRTYPTRETAKVLFDRAGWFQLTGPRNPVLPAFQVQRHGWGPGGSFLARIEAVRLVLFEWKHECQRASERRREAGPSGTRDEDPRADLLATGFLILDVSFDSGGGPVHLDDLLAFNELFRYVQQPYKEHDAEKGYRTVLADLPVDPQQPDRRLRDGTEDEGYHLRWSRLLAFEIEDAAGKRWHLFPTEGENDWNAHARRWLTRGDLEQPSGWAVYADNRAYVSTAAMVEGGLGALEEAFPVEGEPEASRFGHWIRLLNVDPPDRTAAASHGTTPYERRWAENRTYQRWESAGTVYGFTYHSSALLGPATAFLALDAHWRSIYFDQTLLLLYLRVTSFRFSRSLSDASSESRGKADVESWRRRFSELRRTFAVFTNLYEFPLVSNQQQGLELYDLARKTMDVNALFREVREEILGTHEFFESVASQQANEWVARLTVAAMILGTGALVTGFFGMNVFIEEVEALDPLGSILIFGALWFSAGVVLGLVLMRLLLRHPSYLLGPKLSRELFPGQPRKPGWRVLWRKLLLSGGER